MNEIILKPGREKSVRRMHPWIFSGAIADIQGSPAPGETVAVRNSAGEHLGLGAYSPSSRIRTRLWTFAVDHPVDGRFFRDRIHQALMLRARLGSLDDEHTACRLVFAESDGLPGLIVDRYADTLVCQFLSSGAEHWKTTIVDALDEIAGAACIYERSDADVRELEGLPPASGPLLGPAPVGPVDILEDGLHYRVDILSGHKTGFYLDQRENRRRVRELAAGCEVLNCFAYTAGFSIAALAGSAAHVTAIESSPAAIRLGTENLLRNGFSEEEHTWIEGDVFAELRKLRDRDRAFDLIMLDPPKFAATRAQAEGAARGYKDINLLAFKLLRPGGLLVTFSCSGGIGADFFQKIVAGAALDAGASAQIIERLTQSPDHPTALHFPESEYLKGLIIRKSS